MTDNLSPCTFDRAWIGPCGVMGSDGLCEKHTGLKCLVCGGQAVLECPVTSSLVCGQHLCATCKCPNHNRSW